MTVGNNACARAKTREKPREHRTPVQFRVYAAAGGSLHEAERGDTGVMATCNNIVDSYCFVIGPCDATRRVRFAERCGGAEYIAREVVLLEISRGPLRDFRNFSVRVADVTTRRFCTFAFYRRTRFCAFFFVIPFCIFFRASDIV